jgi:drug/metabolite transporter (DMT)-like permease
VKRAGFDSGVTLALAATVAFWASAFAGIRAGLGAYGPGEIALLRFVVASAVLACIALAFTTYAVWAGTLLSLPFLPGLIYQVGEAPPGTTLAMVYLGVFPTAMAYATCTYSFSRLPASRAVSFLYLIPVMAYLITWVWLGEVPTLLSLVGGCLTLSGVLTVNTCGRRR